MELLYRYQVFTIEIKIIGRKEQWRIEWGEKNSCIKIRAMFYITQRASYPLDPARISFLEEANRLWIMRPETKTQMLAFINIVFKFLSPSYSKEPIPFAPCNPCLICFNNVFFRETMARNLRNSVIAFQGWKEQGVERAYSEWQPNWRHFVI